MKPIHDMGGNSGAMIKVDEPELPAFKEAWHGRALAITVASGALGFWNLDTSRHARECLGWDEYQRLSYYEKWLAALANLLVAHGLTTTEEFAHPDTSPTMKLCTQALRKNAVRKVLATGSPTIRQVNKPSLFAIGQQVSTREASSNQVHPGGHTRLPTYASGRIGRVVRDHGAHVLPDSNAHFLGEVPETLYSVAFKARELWGTSVGNAEDEVILDLWESYLELT